MSAELYAELAAIAAEEHGLVMDGRFGDLAELAARRRPLLEQLPDEAPSEALGHLQEALRFQELVTLALIEARDRTARELGIGAARRDGARGYARATGSSGTPLSSIDSQG